MENIGQKKKLCEENPNLALKKMVIAYNSQILKFKIQQTVFYKN